MIKIERNNKKVEITNGSLALIFLIAFVSIGGIITVVALLNKRLNPTDWTISLVVLFICLTIFAIFRHLFKLFKEKVESGNIFAKYLREIKSDISKIKRILEQTEE
jgi:predicted PurR-regulated permease PerM